MQSNLHTGYKHIFYQDWQDKSDELFDQYNLTLLNNIDHPALIQEWKHNLDAAVYEKNKPINKATIKEEKN